MFYRSMPSIPIHSQNEWKIDNCQNTDEQQIASLHHSYPIDLRAMEKFTWHKQTMGAKEKAMSPPPLIVCTHIRHGGKV